MTRRKEIDRIARKALAAVAMAFAPATDIPRERVLIRSAIVSLLMAFGQDMFTENDATKEISQHGSLPELRRKVAKGLFKELISQGILRPAGDGKKSTYQFDANFADKVYEQQKRVDQLIAAIIDNLFDTEQLPPDIKPKLRRTLILVLARLMEKYGTHYACQLVGKAGDAPIIEQHKDLVDICSAAITNDISKYVDAEIMAEAITQLFVEKNPDFTSFIFALTQQYYYLRLLGLDGGLSVLSNDRFSNSKFIIDTNLMISFLFEDPRHKRSVFELLDLGIQLNISFHVTEITLDEFRRVFEHHREELGKIFDEIPDDLTVQSAILDAYKTEHKKDLTLSPERFFSGFSDPKKILENEWDITVFDSPAERDIAPKKLAETKKIINKSSVKVRHRLKGDNSLAHDAHLYYLILEERNISGDNSAWVLTLDRSLCHADRKLQRENGTPFCLSLDGFLHIISPYVRADHQYSFANMFAELVTNNIFPKEDVIKLDDFRMFTSFDISIKNLPTEDVRKVIKKVKRAIISQEPKDLNLIDNKKLVGYEVQKALSDPTLSIHTEYDKRISEQDAQIGSIETERKLEREKHELEKQQLSAQFTSQLEGLHRKLDKLSKEDNKKLIAIEQLTKVHRTLKYLLKAIVSLVPLALIAISIWFIPDDWIWWAKKQVLFKITISASVAFIWFMILAHVKLIQIILGLLAFLAAIFAAVAVFSG